MTGGGSGGSIWITCEEFRGHGSITADGGHGQTLGGGGAGGRMSIQCFNIHKMNVSLSAHGGRPTLLFTTVFFNRENSLLYYLILW